jgi:hypothetical protein
MLTGRISDRVEQGIAEALVVHNEIELRREGGEEFGRGTSGAGQEIVAVEHLVDRDRFDLDRRRAEVKDRDAILTAGTAAEPDDQTRRLGHDRGDITAVVVLAASAAGHLLEMTDQLVDPTHAPGIRTSRASPPAPVARQNST